MLVALMRRDLRRILLLCPLLLTGCMVHFIAPYDPVLDQTMTQVQSDTELFFNQLQAAAGTDAATYNSTQAFYVKTEATVRTLLTRAQSVPKSQEVAVQVAAIESTLERTQKQHERDKTLGTENASLVRQTLESEFRSFFTLELALRAHVTPPANAMAPTTPTP